MDTAVSQPDIYRLRKMLVVSVDRIFFWRFLIAWIPCSFSVTVPWLRMCGRTLVILHEVKRAFTVTSPSTLLFCYKTRGEEETLHNRRPWRNVPIVNRRRCKYMSQMRRHLHKEKCLPGRSTAANIQRDRTGTPSSSPRTCWINLEQQHQIYTHVLGHKPAVT